jgi:alpha-tubulin suppressor-like RCC1 family protein
MAYKSSSLPVEVNGVEDILSDDFETIDSFTRDGSLWLSGSGANGKIGNNTVISYSSPVQTISSGFDWKQVSCGRNMTAAIKTDGTLWMWGSDFYSNLGDSYPGGATSFDRSSPIQVTAVGGSSFGWKQVACSRDSVLAIDADGSLYSWGRGAYYTLGYGSLNNRTAPELVGTKSLETQWKQISHGDYCAGGIKLDGSLWTWGRNYNASANTLFPGVLGRTTTVNELIPGQTLALGNNWLQVSCAGDGTTEVNFAAVKTDGTLWTWGTNTNGQLGINSRTDIYSPGQTASATNDWKQVTCGSMVMAAIKKNGTLWTWGTNSFGELGINSTTNRSTPTQVSTNTTWKLVKAKSLGFSAIKTDGTLWSWGGIGDSIGDGLNTSKSSPVQVVYNYYKTLSEGPNSLILGTIRFNDTFEEQLT